MPRWDRTIEIKQHLGPDKPLAEVRDPIIAVLKADRAYKTDLDFEEIIDDMAAVPTVAVFDEELSRLYDWADEHRVWIGGTPASYNRGSVTA